MRTINQYVSVKKTKKTFSNQWRVLMDNIVLPTIQRVNARQIGLDLVSVQPIGAPNSILNYIDNQYEPTLERAFPFWKIKVTFNE